MPSIHAIINPCDSNPSAVDHQECQKRVFGGESLLARSQMWSQSTSRPTMSSIRLRCDSAVKCGGARGGAAVERCTCPANSPDSEHLPTNGTQRLYLSLISAGEATAFHCAAIWPLPPVSNIELMIRLLAGPCGKQSQRKQSQQRV